MKSEEKEKKEKCCCGKPGNYREHVKGSGTCIYAPVGAGEKSVILEEASATTDDAHGCPPKGCTPSNPAPTSSSLTDDEAIRYLQESKLLTPVLFNSSYIREIPPISYQRFVLPEIKRAFISGYDLAFQRGRDDSDSRTCRFCGVIDKESDVWGGCDSCIKKQLLEERDAPRTYSDDDVADKISVELISKFCPIILLCNKETQDMTKNQFVAYVKRVLLPLIPLKSEADVQKNEREQTLQALYYSVDYGKTETREAIEKYCNDNNVRCDGLCEHCKKPIRIANPSGFCNHIYYPDCCDVCKKAIKEARDGNYGK